MKLSGHLTNPLGELNQTENLDALLPCERNFHKIDLQLPLYLGPLIQNHVK